MSIMQNMNLPQIASGHHFYTRIMKMCMRIMNNELIALKKLLM